MALKAIDCHVHPGDETSLGVMGAGRLEAMARYFGRDIRPVPFEELAETYRSRDMMALRAVFSEGSGRVPAGRTRG